MSVIGYGAQAGEREGAGAGGGWREGPGVRREVVSERRGGWAVGGAEGAAAMGCRRARGGAVGRWRMVAFG